LNQFVEKLAERAGRLAFWRKPEAATLEAPAVSVPVAVAPSDPTSDSETAGALQSRDAEPEGAGDERLATADVATTRRPSLLARLSTLFQRQSRSAQAAPSTEIDPSAPAADFNQAEAFTASINAVAEGADPAGTRRGIRAFLSRKWVWIPGASLALLALIGTMTFMLVQSAQQNRQLQATLTSTQKELKQTTLRHQAQPTPRPLQVAALEPPPAPANETINRKARSASSASSFAEEDCVVSDKTSVIKNLRRCIESFNHAMAQ